MIIDFHAHAFPDALAQRAISTLEAEADGVKAFLDGRISSLVASMDEAGIDISVICSIATRPAQFDPIMKWSRQIQSDRIIAFPSFHPEDAEFRERAKVIAGEGFKGVKFHPYYQDFYLEEDRMLRIYEALMAQGLVVVMHTGYDIAFERIRRADPRQIVSVMNRFPQLKLVTTHLGAWEQWDEVREMIIGRDIYMELSFSVEYLGQGLKDMLESHPVDRVIFGTDSPWTSQKATLESIKSLGLSKELSSALLYGNAARLLGL